MKFKDTGGDFEQPSIGTHVGICVKVIDIGTQRSEYQGNANIRRQCIIAWELPNELMTEGDRAGKPFVVSRFYTCSLSTKANLRKDLENWRGKEFSKLELEGFESKNILGKACMLSLTASDKGKAKITGVMGLPKGTQVPDPSTPLLYFSLDEFNQTVFDGLSDGCKKFITLSPEYRHIIEPPPSQQPSSGASFDDLDDDIPF